MPPKILQAVWTRYDLPSINSSIAAGLDYVDQQVSLDGTHVKPYTIYNMAWKTQLENWTWQVSIKNVFDKEYASSGFINRTGHFPGEPRRVYLSAKYQF